MIRVRFKFKFRDRLQLRLEVFLELRLVLGLGIKDLTCRPVSHEILVQKNCMVSDSSLYEGIVSYFSACL